MSGWVTGSQVNKEAARTRTADGNGTQRLERGRVPHHK